MSKYKTPWKEFDLNKDFWTEVLVGRKVVSFGPGEKKVKIGGDPHSFLTEMVLDSGETVWLAEGLAGSDPTGKTISKLVWIGEIGIDLIEFNDRTMLALPRRGWRICIQD